MSSKFELEKFASQPTAEQLDICRKDDLFSIADLHQITVPHGAVKREIKDVIYKHLVEHGILPEVSEVGVADQLPVSVGEGAEHPKPEEMASIDPVDLPSPSDPRLAINLKEFRVGVEQATISKSVSACLHSLSLKLSEHSSSKSWSLSSKLNHLFTPQLLMLLV